MQKVCLIIPCYNEQYRLPIDDFIEHYNTSNLYYCFVNDGSRDLTSEVLYQFRKGREERVLVINYIDNQGKAEAVRTGVLNALKWDNFSIIGYLDADLATPLSEVDRLLNYFEKDVLIVFGSRVKRVGSVIIRKWYRHILGRIFATCASLLLKIPIYDTQCGAKLMKSETALVVFSKEFLTRWLFDVEIFSRLIEKQGRSNINIYAKEIPLERWADKSGSKIKLVHFIKVPFELLKLYMHR